MKSLNILILVVFSITCIATTINAQTLYVNFIPHDNPTCTGPPSGMGWIFVTGPCIFFPDQDNSYYFQVNALRAGWKIFNETEPLCKGNFTFGGYKNGTCIPNQSFIKGIETPYSMITISDTPTKYAIPPNSVVMTRYASKSCAKREFQFNLYTTNGTVVTNTLNDSTETFSCPSSGEPTVNYCQENECKTTEISATCASDIDDSSYHSIFCS
ncbi:hypothetical protein CYY_000752 [Polysphondylium violaceum]|uniref:Uncharacterized protein n=1 Tax=Polysphondylium violaceum TaxID=133409 RepID=A0A8J4Q481_9MYCE|nr:hypothetical protein CYY_000752 [Polysphondylium violaceum]